MEILAAANADLNAYFGVDFPLLLLVVLLGGAVCVHLVLGVLVRRAHSLAERSSHRWDDVLISALETPIRVVLWFVVMHLTLQLLPVAENLRAQFVQAYDTAVVVLLAWFMMRLINGVEQEMLVEERGRSASQDKASVHATAKLLRITLWILTGLMVLQTLGVSISGLLAFGGIGGIAVGFAAKDLLANFFGGLSIYLDRPFTHGDWIRSPDRNIEGTVEDIGWRLTRIRTFDQRPLYVPNAIFSSISVENPSRMFNRRIHETVGLRYQDADKVAPIVEQVKQMLSEHAEIDLSRTLIVNFVSFSPSSLDFFIYTFTKTTNWVRFHEIKQDVLLKILAIVHANGADVAFPTHTVQMEQPEPEV